MTDAASINYEEAWLIAEQRTRDALAQVDLLLAENGQLKAEVDRLKREHPKRRSERPAADALAL